MSRAVAPWHADVEFEPGFQGQPFKGCDGGPAFGIMADAMRDVHGRDVSLQGDGGSIPLCNVLEVTFPDAQIRLPEVEEPEWPIQAPNDSVDPSEIEDMALVEALILQTLVAE
jgi:cysteinylglycine-S-conjugate dipeptidase